MPRPCTVCAHPDRDAIDRALVAGEPNRRIAARRAVSEQAVRRHKDDHLPAHLARAHAADAEADADDLLARLRSLNRETADVLREAKGAKDHELRLKAIARAEKQIELEGRLLGELRDGATVNVLVAPEWVAARAALLDALRPYPEARVAVAEALAALGGGA